MHLLSIAIVLGSNSWPQKSVSPSPITTGNAHRLMSPGWNLGNTLEAIPNETAWGNAPTTKALMEGVRAAGFRSVRIPAAWTQYSDADNNISPKWMARVSEVVKMAIDSDLYVMLNVHWDGGWLQPTYKHQPKASAKHRKFWKQIATNFKDYDHRLLFAGTNEVMVDGDYGPPKPEYAEVQNSYNQLFVSTVRATGGKNRDRMLVVQGFNTDIDHTLKHNTILPVDTVKDRLMMEVHFYSPYHFVLNEKSQIWQWGAKATDPKATDTWGNEDFVDTQFKRVKNAFVDKGVPVILGEYCTFIKPNFPGMRPYALAWEGYVTKTAHQNGMIPMYWDTEALFHRATGKPRDPERIKVLIDAAK